MTTQNLTRPFQLRADSLDPERRTLEAVISTEAPVEIWDYPSRSIIRESLLMSGVEVAPHVPLLTDHTREVASMVGSIENTRAEGDRLVAQLRFATGTPAADHAWQLYGQRFGRQVSVGYRVLSAEEIPAGRTRVIAGRTFIAPPNMPLRVVTRWQLKEVSLVPIGADSGAMTRSAVSHNSHERIFPMTTLDVLGSQTRSMRWPEYLAAGMKRRGERIPENDFDIGRAALSSVAGVDDLVGVANTTILGGYCLAPDSTQGWVRVMDLPNFLLNEIASVTISPRLEKVARGGSAPTVGYGFANVQGWRLARFGAQFQIDDQDLIDGRAIGVFATAMEELGRAARRLVSDLTYATLLGNGNMSDGTPIFHTDRSNYATAALADTALDAGLAAVGNQVGADEESDPVHLGLSPRYLCIPPDLTGLGRRLARDMRTGDGDLIVRSESRLGAAGIVDPQTDEIIAGTATNWLLACPSDQAPGVAIGALGGSVEPTIRHYSLKNGEFGVGFDVKLDLACTVVNPKPLYFSTGAG